MHKSTGFTLIELIIGITILSLLAVALLAALDPVEQFNKARDTATRNTTMEIHNAMLRYSASKETYPTLMISNRVNVTVLPTILKDLTDSGELKGNFVSAAGSALNQIAMFNDGTTLKTCYTPRSKQFSQAANLLRVTGTSNANYFMPSTFPTQEVAAGCAIQGTTGRLGCVFCAQ